MITKLWLMVKIDGNAAFTASATEKIEESDDGGGFLITTRSQVFFIPFHAVACVEFIKDESASNTRSRPV